MFPHKKIFEEEKEDFTIHVSVSFSDVFSNFHTVSYVDDANVTTYSSLRDVKPLFL